VSVLVRQLRSAARRFKAAVSPRAVILLYHRIADARAGTDPHNLCVSPENFDAQMAALKREVSVVPMSVLATLVADRSLPRRCAAVTFDDGYADNLFNAEPILKRHGLPATVFATMGRVGRFEEFYWDECEQLLSAVSTPRELKLQLKGVDRTFAVGGADESRKRAAVLQVCESIRDLSPAERAEAMGQLRAGAGVEQPFVRPTHRAMNDDEIRWLANSSSFEVGAHTLNHPALPSLPAAEQIEEIFQSKERLESVLGRPVRGFAYPYGLHTAETVKAAEAAGVGFACTTEEHAARHSNEMLRLPRFDFGNCDGETFTRKLRWAFSQ
jgi:peptidoglycan/xylan/chitin deacetylase (PgdA/CDA1 family)